MSDDPIAPLFAHDEPGPRYTVSEAAKVLAGPGVSADTLASQIRSFAQRRIVHVRGTKGSGRTAHNLYAPSDLAVAKILSILTSDLSVSDNALLEAISLALYTWDSKATLPKPHASSPILTAFAYTMQDPDAWWVFDLRAYRHDQTGERRFAARLYDARNGAPTTFGLPKAFLPTASVSMHLRPVLVPIIAAVHGRVGAN